MRRWNVASLLVVIAAAFFSLVRPAIAGEPKQPKPMPQLKQRPPANQANQYNDQSFVTLKVTTNLVVLDVVASDDKGKPVTDLKAGDFTLLEDAKEQKISIFHLQQPAGAPADSKAAPPLPPNIFTNALAAQPLGPRNVIVLDAWRTSPTSQMYARSQVIKFVKELSLNEPMAIFEFGNHALHMLQDFTSDRALLLEAAKKIKPELSVVQWDSAAGRFSPGGYYRSNYGAAIEAQALQELATTLATYPGRKNLIWISDSMTVNPYSHYGMGGPTGRLERSLVLGAFDIVENDNGAEHRKSARALMDSQTAIYPVDPTGVEGVPFAFTAASASSPFSAENGSISRFSGFGDPFGNFGIDESPLFQGSRYRHAVYDEMDDLAARTGGKAFHGRNDIAKALAESVTDGSTYYELGYYPTNHYWDGHFRQITVKVNRPGIKVRYRPGYSAIDPESYTKRPVAMQNADLGRALDLSTPVETALTFYARVTPPSPETENMVAIQYAIDARGINFAPGDSDELEHASVDCVAQAYTEKGTIVKASANTYQASLKPENFKKISQTGFPCRQKLDLPAGTYILKLAARDNTTGAMGTVNARVTVPKLPKPLASAKPPAANR
jgi:VWFA-related protein